MFLSMVMLAISALTGWSWPTFRRHTANVSHQDCGFHQRGQNNNKIFEL